MIKLLISCAHKHDSTSFYRGWGVLHNLNRTMGRTLLLEDLSNRRGWTWADLGEIDILFLQRPYHIDSLKLVQYVKNFGIKVWVDYDDNLFNLPNESRAYFNYTTPVKQTMLKILQLADAVTVSTQALKKLFEAMNVANVTVVPNALNDQLFKLPSAYNHNSNTCAWRGSDSHVGDMVYFSHYMEQAINNTNYNWHFMGYNPFTLTNSVTGRISVSEPQDVLLYHQELRKLKPALMHVPLVYNSLNECKSNIAWIEATWAGAVCVAPAWPEWLRPGVLTYTTGEEYQDLLSTPIPNAAELWQHSKDYIEKNLLLSHVNKTRAEIVNKLLTT